MVKTQQDILVKLKIDTLNPMQVEATGVIDSGSDVVLLSPTGTGKTLAFLLPILKKIDDSCAEIQVLILVPTVELALQIEQVIREMGAGIKVNAVYGGRTGAKDKLELKHRPAILIGTPGRVADHIRRERFSIEYIKTLVIDEYDKSLEIGFEPEMKEIVKALQHAPQKILTSATKPIWIPDFLKLKEPATVDFLNEINSDLQVKRVLSPNKNKLNTLLDTLCHIGYQPGIVFCNLKETVQEVSDYLELNKIAHGCFYGDMEVRDRERSLLKFRNGTHNLLLATDLAARGIDVPDLAFIIHFELPQSNKEYTHRNGRTARMNQKGTAYLLQWEKEELPDFARNARLEKLNPAPLPGYSPWKTLFISGGRKDKISKGDIAGLFLKQGDLKKEELGNIEIKQDCAFVAVHKNKTDLLIKKLDNTRIKTKKVRITVI